MSATGGDAAFTGSYRPLRRVASALLLALTTAAAPRPAAAQEAAPPADAVRRVTLEEATEVALRNNPGLTQARADVGAARSQRTAAVGSFLPRLSAGYDYRKASTGRLDPTGQAITSTSYSSGLQASLDVFDGLRRLHELEAAGHTVEAREMVGRSVTVRNIRFDVVGVLEEEGGRGWWSADEQIFVPLETAQFRLMGTDRVESFDATVAPGASMDIAMMEIEEALRRAHRLRPGDVNDFWIQNRAELLGTFQETSRTFTYLLAGIAIVSLVVGGIGIMNIMLVSVSERTREIGLRKALGARRRDVLVQFLAEALVLCLAGGVLGILLGTGAARAFSAFANWNTAVSPEAVALAVAFSAAVGLFFGIWPARRAARLDPIEALRYE